VKRKTLIANALAVLALGSFAIAHPAAAAPLPPAGQCTLGTQTGGISIGDVQLNNLANNSTLPLTLATDCFGVVSGTSTDTNIGFTGFSLLASTTAPSQTSTATVGGTTFTLSELADGASWSLGLSGTVPTSLDIVAVVQGTFLTDPTQAFASYLFANFPLTGATLDLIAGITFARDEDPGTLSQFAIYANVGEPTTQPPPPPTNVDEPGTAGLLALAGLTLVALGRRRVRQI